MRTSRLVVPESGMRRGQRPEPSLLVIFGATGDLTHRELVPSLFELSCQDLLPEHFAVLGVARSEWSDQEFRRRMYDSAREVGRCDEATWAGFQHRLFYQPGHFDASEDFTRLAGRIAALQREQGLGGNVLFHLATPPAFFPVIAAHLDQAGLAHSEAGWRRLVIEKPFGSDRGSARALDQGLRAVFDESAIYRIDHFLGKETVQNMLVFRFANPSFEPVWNRNYIDHVQITVAEEIGIGTRARFYEKVGVVRDMVQNHLLQLLCMVAIEPPVRYAGGALRDETVKVLEAVQPLVPARDAVRGQYGAGLVDGQMLPGYREEAHVAPDSTTPTFAALRLGIDNWRWAGVPFYLRTGKRMRRKLTEVAIRFKPTPHLMFPFEERLLHNELAFRLQPQEGIIQTFGAKQPGPDLCIRPVTMNFLYADAFGVAEPPRAYAWLLLDAMQGNQTLFARSDWIRRAWEIVDPVVAHWEAHPSGDFPNYAAGTWGPAAAERLIGDDGREWRVI